MASAVARAYNGDLGAVPQRVEGQSPGQEVWGAKPPEAEHNYAFHKPIFAKFFVSFW